MRILSIDADIIQRHDLSPSEAIVLMVIKSFSNKAGNCFPAIGTIAESANLSDRTVSRIVERLENKGLLSREIGGGRMSTLYKISNDILSLQGRKNDMADTTKGHTNSYSYKKETYNTTTTRQTSKGGGGIFNSSSMKNLQEEDVIFPEGKFTPEQRKSLLALLADKTAADAQVYLDELVGRMEVSDISNPTGYVRGMLRNGVFVPELGITIAGRREAEKKPIQRVETVNQEEIDPNTLDPEWRERFMRLKKRRMEVSSVA